MVFKPSLKIFNSYFLRKTKNVFRLVTGFPEGFEFESRFPLQRRGLFVLQNPWTSGQIKLVTEVLEGNFYHY